MLIDRYCVGGSWWTALVVEIEQRPRSPEDEVEKQPTEIEQPADDLATPPCEINLGIAICSRIFAICLTFSQVFLSFRICLDLFGPARMHLGPFGCVWMHSEAFGAFWKFSKKLVRKISFLRFFRGFVGAF